MERPPRSGCRVSCCPSWRGRKVGLHDRGAETNRETWRGKKRRARGLDLPAALAVLRRRIWLVLLCVTVAAGSALALSLLQQAEYSATASLLFRSPDVSGNLLGGEASPGAQDPTREAATNTALASLQVVADRTAKALGGGLTGADVSSNVDVQAQGEANLVSVTATDSQPPVRGPPRQHLCRDSSWRFNKGPIGRIFVDAARLAQRRYASLSAEGTTESRGPLATDADQSTPDAGSRSDRQRRAGAAAPTSRIRLRPQSPSAIPSLEQPSD